MYIDVSRILF